MIDSRHLYARGQILSFDVPPPVAETPGLMDRAWQTINLWLQRSDLPLYKELGSANGKGYSEVVSALEGLGRSIVRVTERGELIVSVAVPIQRYGTVYGSLLLSTEAGDIDAIVHAERLAIVRVFVVAAAVTVLLSILLAGTIAAPLRRLADAADRVRYGMKSRPEIPDYSHRGDEIGHLSQAVRDMTNALYNRIEAIESFAADVAHELKNPLTSLRSAVETLPLARTDEAKARLAAIIQHDVRRLDRLISDISNASRLDAELAAPGRRPGRHPPGAGDGGQHGARHDAARRAEIPARHRSAPSRRISSSSATTSASARSSTTSSTMRAPSAARTARSASGSTPSRAVAIEVSVEDDGPGIRADQFERIFERFYTDRPDQESFGQNSGLGLSISKQIVEAHRGTIVAENRTRPSPNPGEPPEVLGARFTVRLPAE